MPDNVEPFQPEDGPHVGQSRRDPGLLGVGGNPHLVTLRDRRAAVFIGGQAWAAPGSITRMMPDRPGVHHLPNS